MNRLKELREERGYTIRSLSAVIDIHYNTISSYENELRDFKFVTQNKKECKI